MRRLRDCDTGQLNHLAVMYVISSQWNGATGQGGIWAMASEKVNLLAREVLKDRPMFEVVNQQPIDYPCQNCGKHVDQNEEHLRPAEWRSLPYGLRSPDESGNDEVKPLMPMSPRKQCSKNAMKSDAGCSMEYLAVRKGVHRRGRHPWRRLG